jgi:hypothetical protein
MSTSEPFIKDFLFFALISIHFAEEKGLLTYHKGAGKVAAVKREISLPQCLTKLLLMRILHPLKYSNIHRLQLMR